MSPEEKEELLQRAIKYSQTYSYERWPDAPEPPREYWSPEYEAYKKHGRQHHIPTREMLATSMGVPHYKGHTFPKTAEGTANIGGVVFKLYKHVPRGHKTSKHRLYAVCPVCGKDVPVGRMHQHATVHGVGRLRRTYHSRTR
jgi:hypothetical protein